MRFFLWTYLIIKNFKIYFQVQPGSRTSNTSRYQKQKGSHIDKNVRASKFIGPAFGEDSGRSFPSEPVSPSSSFPFHGLCLWARESVLPCSGELVYLCMGVRQPLINIKPHHYLILVYSEIFLNRCHGKFIGKEQLVAKVTHRFYLSLFP